MCFFSSRLLSARCVVPPITTLAAAGWLAVSCCLLHGSLQTFKLNALETMYLVTSLFILLAGMAFQSGVTTEGSQPHLALTYFVLLVLIGSVRGKKKERVHLLRSSQALSRRFVSTKVRCTWLCSPFEC